MGKQDGLFSPYRFPVTGQGAKYENRTEKGCISSSRAVIDVGGEKAVPVRLGCCNLRPDCLLSPV